MGFFGQVYFKAKYFAQQLLHGVATEVTSTQGGGGGKKIRRKRVFKKYILGAVISSFEEIYDRKPALEVAKKVAEAVETIFTEGKDRAMSLYN